MDFGVTGATAGTAGLAAAVTGLAERPSTTGAGLCWLAHPAAIAAAAASPPQ
jgi:hypothetical protein